MNNWILKGERCVDTGDDLRNHKFISDDWVVKGQKVVLRGTRGNRVEGTCSPFSLHIAPKCGLSAFEQILSIHPYNLHFRESNNFSYVEAIIVLRNHFDRVLSVWYEKCVGQSDDHHIPLEYKVSKNSTFRDFASELKNHVLWDRHLKTPSTSQDYANTLLFCHRVSVYKTSILDNLFRKINQSLNLDTNDNFELFKRNPRGGSHHIDYADFSPEINWADMPLGELRQLRIKGKSMPRGDKMYDEKLFSLVEAIPAYAYENKMFERLGLLARPGSLEYEETLNRVGMSELTPRELENNNLVFKSTLTQKKNSSMAPERTFQYLNA